MKNYENLDFLIGKKIVEIKEPNFSNREVAFAECVCSDGTILQISTNEGCGGCRNGWSDINHDEFFNLANHDNAIMNIKYERNDKYGDEYKAFIYFDMEEKPAIVNFDDGTGNGYYGYGFWVNIVEVK